MVNRNIINWILTLLNKSSLKSSASPDQSPVHSSVHSPVQSPESSPCFPVGPRDFTSSRNWHVLKPETTKRSSRHETTETTETKPLKQAKRLKRAKQHVNQWKQALQALISVTLLVWHSWHHKFALGLWRTETVKEGWTQARWTRRHRKKGAYFSHFEWYSN